jgi:hypothetical protein
MAIIRERQEEEQGRELLVVGDHVRLVDSPLDKLKRGAKGRVIEVFGDMTKDKNVLMNVLFRVARQDFHLHASAERFRFTRHAEGEPLPDAENVAPAAAEVE